MTGLVLCIDPGPDQSGYVSLYNGEVECGGRIENDRLLDGYVVRMMGQSGTVLIEWLSCYGSAIGQSVLRTAQFCGEVKDRCRIRELTYLELTRPEVCRRLTGKTRNITKAVIRRAVIDIMGEVGTKREPGPLYIMRSAGPHAWDALALYAAHEKETEAGE